MSYKQVIVVFYFIKYNYLQDKFNLCAKWYIKIPRIELSFL